jgi:hypothetical protein
MSAKTLVGTGQIGFIGLHWTARPMELASVRSNTPNSLQRSAISRLRPQVTRCLRNQPPTSHIKKLHFKLRITQAVYLYSMSIKAHTIHNRVLIMARKPHLVLPSCLFPADVPYTSHILLMFPLAPFALQQRNDVLCVVRDDSYKQDKFCWGIIRPPCSWTMYLAYQVGGIQRIWTIKYSLESQVTQTREGLRWWDQAAAVNYRPDLSSERAL